MSTAYVTDPFISLGQLLAKLPESIVKYEHGDARYTVPYCGLTDGRNYVWAIEHSPGIVEFERFGNNRVYDLLVKLATALNIKIFDQYGLELDPRD